MLVALALPPSVSGVSPSLRNQAQPLKGSAGEEGVGQGGDFEKERKKEIRPEAWIQILTGQALVVLALPSVSGVSPSSKNQAQPLEASAGEGGWDRE